MFLNASHDSLKLSILLQDHEQKKEHVNWIRGSRPVLEHYHYYDTQKIYISSLRVHGMLFLGDISRHLLLLRPSLFREDSRRTQVLEQYLLEEDSRGAKEWRHKLLFRTLNFVSKIQNSGKRDEKCIRTCFGRKELFFRSDSHAHSRPGHDQVANERNVIIIRTKSDLGAEEW